MSTPRPRGSRLLTAFSPKLGRTVRAFDHTAFEHWVRLEVDPGVTWFCEYPCRVGVNDDGRLIDFWVARHGQEEMLVVERGQGSVQLPKSVQALPLRQVPAAEQAAAAVWVANWLRHAGRLTGDQVGCPVSAGVDPRLFAGEDAVFGNHRALELSVWRQQGRLPASLRSTGLVSPL